MHVRLFARNRQIKEKPGCENDGKQKNWWYPLRMDFGSANLFGHNYLGAYKYIAGVRTVIDKRAKCLGNAKSYVLDKNGNEPQSGKALELRQLFAKPNFFQSFSEFYVLKEIYRLLFGWSAVYTPRAFAGAVPYAMFIVPPGEITFKLHNRPLYLQNSIENFVEKVNITGMTNAIDINDLIIFCDSIPLNGNPIISESRMASIFREYDLTSAISEAEKTIVERQGALGILSKDINDVNSTGVFEDERTEIQRQYRENYGLRMSKDQIIITELALKWQQMSMPVKDLMLIELDSECLKKIAGVYEVPFNLLPGGSDSTFSNQKEAKKMLYQETAIPASDSDAEKFTQAMFEKHGLKIKFDYSDLYLFQEDLKEKAATVNLAVTGLNKALEAGNITLQEWRQEMSKYMDIDPGITPNNTQNNEKD